MGDAICVYYNNRKYFIDVVEAKPSAAISVIETDCEVPFYLSVWTHSCRKRPAGMPCRADVCPQGPIRVAR